MTELTVILPLTLALIRFGKPVPGSKNPEPEEDVPVTVTFADACPAATVTGRCRLRRRRREKFHNFHAVSIGAVAQFLDRPHRHVVARIDAGKGIVSPAMRSVLLGSVGWVVVAAARGEDIRRIDEPSESVDESTRRRGVNAEVMSQPH